MGKSQEMFRIHKRFYKVTFLRREPTSRRCGALSKATSKATSSLLRMIFKASSSAWNLSAVHSPNLSDHLLCLKTLSCIDGNQESRITDGSVEAYAPTRIMDDVKAMQLTRRAIKKLPGSALIQKPYSCSCRPRTR